MMRRVLPGIVVVVGVVVLAACICEECDQVRTNKELVADAFKAVEAGDLDTLGTYIAADYVRHCQATPDVVVTSLDEFKEYLRHDREAVPNPTLTVHRLIGEDDLVAFWATYSGNQEGSLGPFPATGKRLELDFAGVHRIANGKIAETWVTWDNMTALGQLGVLPPMPGEGEAPVE
jgi:predicted ester cyclase